MKYIRLLLVLCILCFISCSDLEEDDCRTCYGLGYTYCSVCKNTGCCVFCENGFKECTYCSWGKIWNGEEYVTCTACNGNYKTKCFYCNGYYLGECWACHGKKRICADCNGTGKIEQID